MNRKERRAKRFGWMNGDSSRPSGTVLRLAEVIQVRGFSSVTIKKKRREWDTGKGVNCQ